MRSAPRRNPGASHGKREQLIDDTMDRYITWRERAAAVRVAYDACARVRTRIERSTAFGALNAALDQEQSAAEEYAAFLADVTRVL